MIQKNVYHEVLTVNQNRQSQHQNISCILAYSDRQNNQILKSTKDIAKLNYKPGTDHAYDAFKMCKVASVMVLWFIRKTVLSFLDRFFVFLLDFKLVLNVHILCITKILIWKFSKIYVHYITNLSPRFLWIHLI